MLIGVGGCVASQEGAAIIKRAPYVDLVFGPQTLHRLPRDDRQRAARPASRRSTSRFPKSRSSTACPSRAPKARPRSSRSWKAARSTARSASCRTRAARKSGGRSTTCWPKSPARRPGRARSDAARPERQRVSRAAMRDVATKIADFGTADPRDRRDRRHRPHPLHDFASAGILRRLIDAYANVPKLANFLHLPVQSGSDRILSAMKRGYTALEYKQKIRKLRAVRPDICDLVGLHRRLPGRDRRRFREDMKLIDDVGFDQSFSFIYSPASRHAGRESHDETPTRSSTSACNACRRRSTRTRGASAKRWSAACSACWSKARAQGRANELDRPHREHALRQFRRFDARLIGEFVDVTITEAMSNSLRGRVALASAAAETALAP